MDNITLLTCSYNTPDVTLTMLKSFFKHHGKMNVIVCENSSNNETENILKDNNVPYVRCINGLHAPSVDILLGKCETDYALLVDTDVICLKPHNDIFEQFKKADITLLGEICGDRGGKSLHNRVHPWHCFINVKHIKAHGIKFFDKSRLGPGNGKIYDVGASFFEDVRKAKLKIGNIKLQDSYFRHYEGMSWRTLKYGVSNGNIDLNPEDTHNDINLFKYGKLVENFYLKEIDAYKDISIK